MRLDAGDDARGDLRLRPLRGLCLRLTFRLAADAAAWRYAPTHSTSRRMPRHHECMRKWGGKHGRQTGIALRAYSSTSRRVTRHHECMREWRGEHDWQTVMARSAYIPHGWYNAPPRMHEKTGRRDDCKLEWRVAPGSRVAASLNVSPEQRPHSGRGSGDNRRSRTQDEAA